MPRQWIASLRPQSIGEAVQALKGGMKKIFLTRRLFYVLLNTVKIFFAI
jgi:hypothetical protein